MENNVLESFTIIGAQSIEFKLSYYYPNRIPFKMFRISMYVAGTLYKDRNFETLAEAFKTFHELRRGFKNLVPTKEFENHGR